jgi:hypothetical protein
MYRAKNKIYFMLIFTLYHPDLLSLMFPNITGELLTENFVFKVEVFRAGILRGVPFYSQVLLPYLAI